MTVTIALDPGHGADDRGAVVGKWVERDLNLALAARVARLINTAGDYTGWLLPLLTRESNDVDPSFKARVERSELADVAVILHHNAAATDRNQGGEFYIRPGHNGDLLIAESIRQRFPDALGGKLLEADPHVDWMANAFNCINFWRCPVVLVEVGFLSNPRDLGYITSESGRAQVALAIAAGVIDWVARRDAVTSA